MRKIAIFIIIISILFASSMSYALNLEGPFKKLGRGIANVATCPLELIKCIGDANYENGPIAALTHGFVRGAYRTFLRLAVGGYEVITFPIPLPKDYDPIMTDPEFFLSDGLF